jgi:peptidoglycan/xylan/chitin deacetylase (PgdA/CDA1 family)
MGESEIKEMIQSGMTFGPHGNSHLWLSTLSKEEIYQEVDLSLEFLVSLGQDVSNWIMCYPYGDWSQDVLDVCKERNCTFGITTEVRVADVKNDNPLILPRLDTNDIPKDGDSETNDWFLKG